MRPTSKVGDSVKFADVGSLVGAWVRKKRDGSDYTVIPGGTAHSNPRLMDEDGTVFHVAPGGWSEYMLVAFPPAVPDYPSEAVEIEDAVRRQLATEREFRRMAGGAV